MPRDRAGFVGQATDTQAMTQLSRFSWSHDSPSVERTFNGTSSKAIPRRLRGAVLLRKATGAAVFDADGQERFSMEVALPDADVHRFEQTYYVRDELTPFAVDEEPIAHMSSTNVAGRVIRSYATC